MEATDFEALNAVCLKKMATATAVAAATGRGEAEVAPALGRLVSEGLLADVGGTLLPTDDAAAALDAAAAQRYADARGDPELANAADTFEPINRSFLDSMTAWQQVRVGGKLVTNDHADADYDEKVITRIDRLVERLDPVLAAFENCDGRFGAYRRRFGTALDEVARGKRDYVSLPTVDSVHNVWFEFHEDLLRTLGREREE